MSIFKAYDIRGLYSKELGEKEAFKIGQAIVSYLQIKKIVIGRDARNSSNNLFKALGKGIVSQGCDVFDIGLSTTPMLAYASQKYPAAIMITASHLPQQYNGFKLFQNKGMPIGENEIQKIKKIVEQNNFVSFSNKGKIYKKSLLEEYIRYNLSLIAPNLKQLKIVLDSGNGMSGYTLPRIFKKIPEIKLVELYTDLDFNFPNHESNPLNLETLKELQDKIKREKADFGFATDADGDRCIFIDEKGVVISSDLMIALIGKYVLKNNKQAKIMYDVRCSKIVKEVIEENGGQAIISRVGHSFIKKKMRENNVIFAGEISGHLYYKKNNYAESPFISAISVANILSNSTKSLSELINPFQKYFSSGEINFKVTDKNLKIEEIEKALKNNAIKIEKLDGLSIYYKDWWFNVRKSNTENLLRLNLEAHTKKIMLKKIEEITKNIKS